MLLDFFEPVGEGIESLLARNVVGQEDAVRATVENTGDGLVGLLASSVPNLHFDKFVFETQPVGAELDANGDLVLGLELVVHDPLHEARLAHARVPNNNEFEHVVVLLLQRFVTNMLEWLLPESVDLTLLHLY